MLATTQHAELHDTGNLLTETNTARAVNAAAHFLHRDQWANILGMHNSFFFVIARSRGAITDRQILQLAFATLIADRAIQRMIQQQKLHHIFLRAHCLFTVGTHDHARRDWRRAGGQRLGCFFDFDQTHATVRRNRQFLVIAKVRDIGTQLVGSIHHHAAFLHFDFFAVYFNLNHGESGQRYVGTRQRLCSM